MDFYILIGLSDLQISHFTLVDNLYIDSLGYAEEATKLLLVMVLTILILIKYGWNSTSLIMKTRFLSKHFNFQIDVSLGKTVLKMENIGILILYH